MGRLIEYFKSIFLDEELIDCLSRVFGDRLRVTVEALRRPPSRYYVRVNTLKTSVNDVYRGLVSRGFEVYMDYLVRDALYFRVKGPNRLPSASRVVVADKYASESVYQGADLYAPGVLKADGVFKGDEVIVTTPYGEPVGWGVAEVDGDEMVKNRFGVAVRVLKSVYEAPKIQDLEEYRSGLIFDQSLPAMLTSIVLDPKPGEVVVDMCAAPGGKATHIAQLTGGNALILAFDNSNRRLDRLRREICRVGVSCIRVFKADSRYLDVDYSWIKADRVLIDPPCSTIGVRPKLQDVKKYRDVKALADYQKQFIKVAARIVRDGGVIVYSTCTLTPEENEFVVDYAVRNLKLRIDEQPIYIASRGLSIVDDYDLLQRFYPDTHDTLGYFIARFVKRS